MAYEDTLKNIQQLKKEFLGEDPGAVEELKLWEGEVKRAAVISQAQNNKAIKMVLEEAYRRVQMANAILLNDRDLAKEQRDKILERRDSYEWFIGFFEAADQKVKAIKKNVKDEME